jgi:signal transduction histidine kinase/ligand-binding sensor domain-containing protein/CheY-like chemotaxis protein
MLNIHRKGLPCLLLICAASLTLLSGCAAPDSPPAPGPVPLAEPLPAIDIPDAIVSRPRHDNDILFDTISLEEGLSQSVVVTMLQDRTGFMWFGTQDGLNRYDGYTFRVHKADLQDVASLPNNFINALAEDAGGSLWVGTPGGLSRYDPYTERFQTYHHETANPNSLSSDAVTELLVDHEGMLWVGTVNTGLNRFDATTGRFERYRSNPAVPDSLSGDSISALFEDSQERLWVGTTGSGLCRMDPPSGRFECFLPDADDPTAIQSDTVLAIAEDTGGLLWLASANGLIVLDPKTRRFYRIPGRDGATSGLINTVAASDGGVMWVATAGAGLLRFADGVDGPTSRYYPVDGLPGALPTANIQSILQDRSGALWFGTFGSGLARYSWMRDRFALYRRVPGDETSLSDYSVWGLCESANGSIWLGTGAAGLDRFDPNTGTFEHYPPADDGSGPHSGFVLSVLEDSQHNVWVGTTAGLDRYVPTTGEFIAYNVPSFVVTILETRAGGLFIGTFSGLGLYDPESDSFSISQYSPADPTSIPDNAISVLAEDSDGNVWIGTFNGGLARLEPGARSFIRYPYNPSDPAGLAAPGVLDITEDSRGRLWVATAGAGLALMDPAAGTFRYYRETDGLPNNTVYGIVEDDRGFLWLSTNRGLSRFDPDTETFENFTPADGLQSMEFNQSARLKDSSGRVYFGGIAGLNVFDPDDLAVSPSLPPVVITGFKLFNEPVAPGPDSPLRYPITYSQAISLSFQQNFVTFEFAALDYVASGRIQYAYRMEGLEQNWNEVGGRNFALYTALPAGDYTFRVRAAGSSGVWNESGTSLRVTIVPPFWQRIWFRALAIALGLGSIAGVVGLRLRMVQAQNRRLERLVDERTHQLNETVEALRRSRDAAEAASRAKSVFLANISHELRTPLNAVLGFSQLMLSQPSRGAAGDLTPAQRDNLAIINRSGEHLLGLINDVLEMSKIEAGRVTLSERSFDLHRLLQGLEDMFELRAHSQGLGLEIDLDAGLPRFIHADEGKLRQIIMNLLGNAIKFTQEGGIEVRVALGNGAAAPGERAVLRVEIEDTGPGIAPEELGPIFEPFVQASAGRQSQEGTGLGLSICRQYARLMGGTLSAASEVGRGSTFTLEIPVTVSAMADEEAARLRRHVLGLEPGQPVYRLLVVDDKEVNRQLLVRLFEPLGFEVREAVDGQAALDIWEAWEPHLIWMDMRMPVMNGYEATRRIKATTRGQATVVIALTASALEEDRQIILSEGCDDYIRKPFRDQELFDALSRHLGVRFVVAEEGEGETPARPPQPDAAATQPAAESSQQMRALPPDAVAALARAARLGDLEGTLAAIQTIRLHDPALADVLARWAEEFDHTSILTLIDEVATRGHTHD